MAGRNQIVIDSSVAVKWFSEEEKTTEALALRNAHVEKRMTLLTTPLLTCEVANALRYKPDFNLDRFTSAMNYLLKLHLHETAVDERLLSRSGEISFKSGVTIYDAIPVALAVLMKTKCITADRETQYAKLRGRNYPIELL
jgi:predicted nucleic acid-binding protein